MSDDSKKKDKLPPTIGTSYESIEKANREEKKKANR